MITKTSSFLRTARKKLKGKRGQTLVEYGMILTFITVLAIAVLSSLGAKVKGTYTTINSELSAAQAGSSGSGSGSGGSGGGGGGGGTGNGHT